MTTRTFTRMLFVLVAALAIALLGAEGEAAAVKKQNTGKTTGQGKTPSSATQQARKGKKRKGRATKKRPKKKEKKPEKPVEEPEDEEAVAEPLPEDEGASAEPEGPNGGSKLRKSAAGASLEPKPSLGGEGVSMSTGSGLRQSNRMEFDARVVRGETAGSGAVILFERGPRHLAPLTKKRTRFLDETIESVLGKEEAVVAREKRERARKRKPAKKQEKPADTAEKKPEKKIESNGKSDSKSK